MRQILLFITLALTACAAPAAAPKDVTPAKAAKILEGKVQLLDVRTKEEWNAGHLEGATRIDIKENGFTDKAVEQLDKSKPVLVYCRSGRRSADAAKRLSKAGFTEIYDLQGGITAWTADGREVVK